jgi:hypothetical protein
VHYQPPPPPPPPPPPDDPPPPPPDDDPGGVTEELTAEFKPLDKLLVALVKFDELHLPSYQVGLYPPPFGECRDASKLAKR